MIEIGDKDIRTDFISMFYMFEKIEETWHDKEKEDINY